MARVNLEQRFFAEARLQHLAMLLACSTHEAIGALAYLWHDSQELGRVVGTKKEIAVWARWREIYYRRRDTSHGEPPTEDDFIYALEESGYIRAVDDLSYQIQGNEAQLEWNVKAKEKAAKAANARWAKEKNAPRNATPDAPSNAHASKTECHSIQGNAIQDKAMQGNLAAAPAAPDEDDGPTPGSLVWDAYSDGFKERYQESPVRNAKQNALCKQFASRIPGSEAPEVARFYLEHHHYAQFGHPLTLLVRDAEKIRTEWATGRVIKPDRMKTAAEARSQHNRELYQKIQRGEV